MKENQVLWIGEAVLAIFILIVASLSGLSRNGKNRLSEVPGR
jgi:hypothetical protein